MNIGKKLISPFCIMRMEKMDIGFLFFLKIYKISLKNEIFESFLHRFPILCMEELLFIFYAYGLKFMTKGKNMLFSYEKKFLGAFFL